jgi:type VI secretion system protein ImpK
MSDAIYRSCADVLILATQLASASDLPAPNDLRQRIMGALDRMVASARSVGVAEADIVEARYALVAFIDEQILKSNWPGRAEWMNQPLQLVLYREYAAGENFFARMRALLQQGGRTAALEAYFLCLALGFRGAYGVSGNIAALTSFTDAARQQLAQRLPSSKKISPNATPRDRAESVRKSNAPLIALLVGCAILLVVVLGALEWSLDSNIKEATQTIPARAASSAR